MSNELGLQILDVLSRLEARVEAIHQQVSSHRDRIGRLEEVAYGQPPTGRAVTGPVRRSQLALGQLALQLAFVLAFVAGGGLILGRIPEWPEIGGLAILAALIAGRDLRQLRALLRGDGGGGGLAAGIAAVVVVAAVSLGGCAGSQLPPDCLTATLRCAAEAGLAAADTITATYRVVGVHIDTPSAGMAGLIRIGYGATPTYILTKGFGFESDAGGDVGIDCTGQGGSIPANSALVASIKTVSGSETVRVHVETMPA